MPRALTITAIIAAYNEEDVIGAVLADLLEQGVRVHLLDHGSTDGTVAEAERLGGRGLLTIERLEGADFSLARVIRRKEILAAELESDWFVNADADEFRESPWPGVGFAAGLHEVDRLGFNAIDFAVLNFRPVHDGFTMGDDPREVFRFYQPGAQFDRLQIRCWKKQPGPLDLVATAGHEARFANRRVFPLRFLLRHYPIRGQAHGERKVFQERLARFSEDERAQGWHVQYDGLQAGASFLCEPSSLTPYDPWLVRLETALRHRGVEALEAEIAAVRAELEERRREGAGLGVQLAASRQETAGARAELESSRRELSDARAALEASRREAVGLGIELGASRQALLGVRAEWESSQRELSDARAALEASRREASGLGVELAARRQESLGVRAEWESSQRELSDARAALEASRREASGLGAELGTRRQEVVDTRAALADAVRQRSWEVAALRNEQVSSAETSRRRIDALQARLDAILASRIWRWTRALRALLDAIAPR